MKTSDLIDLLAKNCLPAIPLNQEFKTAIVAGTVIARIAFFAFIGVRHDIGAEIYLTRFLFKFIITAELAVASGIVLRRTGKPGVAVGSSGWIFLIPAGVLLLAASAELLATRFKSWMFHAIGQNAPNCVTLIPLLSIRPLACLIYGLRKGAPEDPSTAGAIAGLTSAAIAASFYTANCDEDSPLFVLLWYRSLSHHWSDTSQAGGFYSGRVG